MPSLKHDNPPPVTLPRKVWRLFSSPKLALVLILVLVALCLIGALLVQAPSQITSDPASYEMWVTNMAEPKFGVWANIFSALHLFDVFHSPWFVLTGVLLIINIFVCTLNRWTGIIAGIRGKIVKQPPLFYRSGAHKAESALSLSPDKAAGPVTEILKKHHYKASINRSSGSIHIAAVKNRYFPLGTFLTHLSLIVFVLGFIVGGFWGFRNETFVVPEGTIQLVGDGTGMALELTSFEDEYWPNGSPRDYRSQVILYTEEGEVARSLVRVNSPLTYHGISFYQSGFGPAAWINIMSENVTLFDDNVPLTYLFDNSGVQRYAGEFTVPDTSLTIQVLSAAVNSTDPDIGADEVGMLIDSPELEEPVVDILKMGVTKDIGGFQFLLAGQGQYSIFQVSHNPGITLIWIGCTSLVIGLSLVFYFPRRQLWVLIEPSEGAKSRLLLRIDGRMGSGSDEINTIIQQINENII